MQATSRRTCARVRTAVQRFRQRWKRTAELSVVSSRQTRVLRCKVETGLRPVTSPDLPTRPSVSSCPLTKMTQPETHDPTEEGSPEASLERVVDAVTDLATGIPAPVRRNAFKAFGRLCTAAVEIPVAMAEGKAAELRAESQARVNLIGAIADGISSQIVSSPEYAAAAFRKFSERVIRERVNLDRISEAAAVQLANDTEAAGDAACASNVAQDEVGDDWLNVFEKEASQKSSVELQQVFSRILAGEIRKPTSYSIKTLRILGQMDGRVAVLFQQLCSIACTLRVGNRTIDTRVVSLGGNAGGNVLEQYGLTFSDLNALHEYGLIIADFNSIMDYRLAVIEGASARCRFEYNERLWSLAADADYRHKQALQIEGVALSRSGAELFQVVERLPDEVYTAALKEFFRTKKLTMVPEGLPAGA